MLLASKGSKGSPQALHIPPLPNPTHICVLTYIKIAFSVSSCSSPGPAAAALRRHQNPGVRHSFQSRVYGFGLGEWALDVLHASRMCMTEMNALPVPCDMAASQVRLLLTHTSMLLLLLLLTSFVLAAAVDPSTTSGNLMPLSPVT